MSFRAMLWAWEVDGLTSTTKLVLMSLANHAGEHTGSCFPSIKKVAGECRLSERAVQVAIKTLETEGYIAIRRRPQTANYFTLLMDLKVVATRVKDVHQGVQEPREAVNDVREGGERRAPEPVNQPSNQPSKTEAAGDVADDLFVLPPMGEKTRRPSKAEANAALDVQALVETWNRICGPTMGTVQFVSDVRRKALLARMMEFFENDPAKWEAYCRKMSRSRFLTGEKTDFRASFDWSLAPRNVPKVLEGQYNQTPEERGEARPVAAPYAGYNPHLRPGDPGWRPSPGTI